MHGVAGPNAYLCHCMRRCAFLASKHEAAVRVDGFHVREVPLQGGVSGGEIGYVNGGTGAVDAFDEHLEG